MRSYVRNISRYPLTHLTAAALVASLTGGGASSLYYDSTHFDISGPQEIFDPRMPKVQSLYNGNYIGASQVTYGMLPTCWFGDTTRVLSILSWAEIPITTVDVPRARVRLTTSPAICSSPKIQGHYSTNP